MSLTRKLLESLGLESDKVSTIIDAHVETVDALKGQIEQLKSTNTTLEATNKELTTAKAELENLKETGGDWQAKYEKEHSDFEAYKTAQDEKATLATKTAAYREMLKEVGLSDKLADMIIKSTDIKAVELADDGKIKDVETVTEALKTEWADYIPTTDTKGAGVAKPPANNDDDGVDYDNMSMAEYIAARKK